jgi:hypothetical protein
MPVALVHAALPPSLLLQDDEIALRLKLTDMEVITRMGEHEHYK